MEILNWSREESNFVLLGKTYFSPITECPSNKKGRTLKFSTASSVLVTNGKPNQNYSPESLNSEDGEKTLMFPRGNTGITEAYLILLKEKYGRFVLLHVSQQLDLN